MATSFKTFLNNDVTNTKTLLHELIPITGTIISGTYTDKKDDERNIKNYAHGMFQSVHDYPYLSSSANHIFDIAAGYSNTSVLSASTNEQNSKKINVYTQMAQLLSGYDKDGNIRDFDEDGDFASGGTKMKEVFFLNFSRLLVKDEIKKGSFSVILGTNGGSASFDSGGNFAERLKVSDDGAQDDYRVNSPAGEYGILYASNDAGTPLNANATSSAKSGFAPCGLIYYQAGVAVISSSVFLDGDSSAISGDGADGGKGILDSVEGTPRFTHRYKSTVADANITAVLTGSTVKILANGIRNRIQNVQFNNTTELNSTIYFCRANHNEFNYSSNPTYLSDSKLVVKNESTDNPVAYATTVGLYSADNELLAVAKLSEPIKKEPSTEVTFRVRLDY
jgi:hypothetical protein